MTTESDFIFRGSTLEDDDLPRIGKKISVGEDILHATIDVETGGNWTDRKGRIPILYEPHVAYRAATSTAVRDKLVKAGLAYPKWGTKKYPADSYPSLLKAIAIDEETALRACSWGGPQILGEEFEMSGFRSAKEMVISMLAGEANQLEAMVDFIKAKHLDDELRVLQAKLDKGEAVTPDDCRAFVRGYNGAAYAKNDYHTKYARALNKWVKIPDTQPWTPKAAADPDIPTPDLYDGKFHKELESVQSILNTIGYPEIGTVDGKWGSRTAGVILTFRQDNGLQTDDPRIDAEFLALLATKPQRQINPARANATVADLREAKDPDIKQTDQTKTFGFLTAGGGALMGVNKGLEQVKGAGDMIHDIIDTLSPVQTFLTDNLYLILGGIGAFVVWKSGVLQKIRLVKHQTGEDVSV